MSMVASELLHPGLLLETSILVVTTPSSSPGEPPIASFGHAVREACERLGARVGLHVGDAAVDETAMDAAVASTAAESGGIDMLVVDGAALFASGGLHACLDSAWNATRAVVNLAFLLATPSPPTRRIVYLAPAPIAGEQADAARAGLENLARTLSVEWARHAITLVTIALGDATTPGEAAALTAYLASPAGAYFSGAQLDLRGV